MNLQTAAGASTRGLGEVDPGQTLRAAGAQVVGTLSDAPLTPGQKIEGTVEVDPDAAFAEADEGNGRQIALECPGE